MGVGLAPGLGENCLTPTRCARQIAASVPAKPRGCRFFGPTSAAMFRLAFGGEWAGRVRSDLAREARMSKSVPGPLATEAAFRVAIAYRRKPPRPPHGAERHQRRRVPGV